MPRCPEVVYADLGLCLGAGFRGIRPQDKLDSAFAFPNYIGAACQVQVVHKLPEVLLCKYWRSVVSALSR